MKTVLLPKNDTDVYIDLRQQVFDSIRYIRDSYNGKVTTGVVVYELLMMNDDYIGEYRDAVDELEERIDAELQQILKNKNKQLSGDFADIVRRVDTEIWMRGRLREESKWGETARSLKISLPEQMNDSLTFERGWNDRLCECLANWIESPFASRLYRIESKQSLIRYVETDSIPNDEVAKAIISQNTSEFKSLLRLIDVKIESKTEYKTQADELDGWQDERYPALDNFADGITREDMTELIKEAHDVDTDWYAEQKVEEFADEYNHPHLLKEEGEDNQKKTVLDRMTDKERANLSTGKVHKWADEAETEQGLLELVSQALVNELNRNNEVTEVDAELCLEDVGLNTDEYGISDLPKVMSADGEIERL